MWFPPDHPLPVRVRSLCLPYPEAVEAISHGRCTFRAGKRQFAIVGVGPDPAVLFLPDDLERPALLERDDVFIPPYEGASGWLALRVDVDAGDWTLLAELIDTSYRRVALQRQLRALDAAGL
ncbi:MmcQ/YjbR family DNA-binding protein [Microbacterium jejuense]|uniref:MmcQ/YjbR family DNA-binding protein n=2 Tax=Microbacterium jejuense TaxID=1263637 RepID=A0ABS7HGX7_9MICO|nr:MmcQ/YjbR family DNA-binding protein [Microbacterium jejuense]